MNAHPKYSAEKVATTLTETKGMVTLAAKSLGCAPNTVRRYLREYASCRQALEDAREQMGDTAELALYKAIIDGEGWAIAFYLRTQGRNRGYVERQEITGKDGGPMEVSVEDARDKLASRIASIAARTGAASLIGESDEGGSGGAAD